MARFTEGVGCNNGGEEMGMQTGTGALQSASESGMRIGMGRTLQSNQRSISMQ